jgi:hypothetical protein
MQHKTFSALVVFTFIFTSCSSAPKKTGSETSVTPSPATPSPVQAPEEVTKLADPVAQKESLQSLQNSVYALEDKIYGVKKLGTLGSYGELKNCRRKLASRQYGGSGDLLWTEPLDRVTVKETDVKVTNSKLTTPDEVQNQLMRFRGYKTILQRRSDEYDQSIIECKSEVAKKELDPNQSSRVMVTEVSKGSMDKAAVNEFLCQFVKKDASLKSLMVELFAKSWLSLSDFSMEQNLIASSLKDAKGASRDNGMLFNGWKFAFDQAHVTVADLLSGDKDAKLVAWTYAAVADVKDHDKCLKPDPQWNP